MITDESGDTPRTKPVALRTKSVGCPAADVADSLTAYLPGPCKAEARRSYRSLRPAPAGSGGEEPAVDLDGRAGDPGGLVRGQEHGCPGDVPGRSAGAERRFSVEP